jgi:mannose-6-phosphate isomerase
VTHGDLEVGDVPAPRGSTLLLPAAAGPVTVRGTGELLIARPPAP